MARRIQAEQRELEMPQLRKGNKKPMLPVLFSPNELLATKYKHLLPLYLSRRVKVSQIRVPLLPRINLLPIGAK